MKQLSLDLEPLIDWEQFSSKLVERGFKGDCSVWKKHMRTAANLFNASCVIHDVCYARGGTEKERMDADRGLYRRSILNAASLDTVLGMWYYCFVATTWYIAVRCFGWAAFYYGEPRSSDRILEANAFKHTATWKQRANKKFNEWVGIK